MASCERCGQLYPKVLPKCRHCGDLSERGLLRLQAELASEHDAARRLGLTCICVAALLALGVAVFVLG